MSVYPVDFNNIRYYTNEHLFQSLRFPINSEIVEQIKQERNPFKAKLIAKANKDKMIIVPASAQDLYNMRVSLEAKLKTNRGLIQELIDTGDAMIVEDVTKRGASVSNLFWGAMLVDGKWVGINTVGNIWMDIRKDVIENPKKYSK